MKSIDKKELASLRKEVNAEIREIKASIKAEEKRDEFSRKVDRLYDRLEGNELLLSAIDMVISETKGQRLSDDQLQNIVKEFKDSVDFSERNGASFSSRDVLDRVLISNTNESFKSRRKRIKESRVSDSYSSRDELSEFLGDARDKRRDIEQLDFDDMDESIRRRRSLRRVIESRRRLTRR